MHAFLGNKKLIPSNVTTVPVRFSNAVSLNGFYYQFNKMSEGSYPLELALIQIPVLKKYELVFIENVESDTFLGIFLKSPNRKTILLDKKYFLTHLFRYKKQFNNIAIINNTDILEKTDDYNQLSNVDFIAIEKLPVLIDPNKKNQIIKIYSFSILLIILTIFSTNIQINMHNDDLIALKDQLNSEMNINNELVSKTKRNMIPSLPTKEVQTLQLNQILSQIDNGGIK